MDYVQNPKRAGIGLVAATVGLTLVGLYACGPSHTGGGGSDFSCSLTTSGQESCYAYSNLAPDQDTTARSLCANQGGSVVSACPTSNLIGCCALTTAGIAFQDCYYFGTSSSDQMGCATAGGTWTDGSGAISGSSGGVSSRGGSSSSGSGSSSGGTCSSVAGGPVCCSQGYCTLGTAHGYAFGYSDMTNGGASSASLATDGTLCVHGTAVGAICADPTCYATYWGAGMGVNVNQAPGATSTVGNYAAAGSTGVTYALNVLPQNARLVVGDSTTDYCVLLTSPSGTVPWKNFNSTCWSPATGTSLGGPPPSFTSVRFQIASDDTNGGFSSFDFCLDQLGF